MTSKLQTKIQQATNQAWLDWEKDHPNLAKLIDEVELKKILATNIENSPEYQSLNLTNNFQSDFYKLADIAKNILISFLR